MQTQLAKKVGLSLSLLARREIGLHDPSLQRHRHRTARTALILLAVVVTVLGSSLSWAAPKEGEQAYNRGGYTTALKELRLLAEQGDAAVQFRVGEMYQLGKGVQRDEAEAACWFLRSAE